MLQRPRLRLVSFDRTVRTFLCCLFGVMGSILPVVAEEEFPAKAFDRYCVDCHGQSHAEAEVNLEGMLSHPRSFALDFKTWRTAKRMLAENRMPPEEAAQPTPDERRALIAGIEQKLAQTAREQAQDPGEVLLRRLTSAEYEYTIRDLTQLDLNLRDQLVGDAVGGEGFTNVGRVQFLQDSTLEQYLQTAKAIASHAVIGAGPLTFYEVPGKTGLERSAMARIDRISREHGFRTAAGEGGEAYGLDRYPRAFFAGWRYKHRATLGQPQATLKTIARDEGLDARFVEHVWSVLTKKSPTFPTSEIISRWQSLPGPKSSGEQEQTAIRKRCQAIHDGMLDWQSRFGKNPDAKEEAPLLAAEMFEVSRFQEFDMNINWPEGTKTAHIQMAVDLANHKGESHAVVIWHSPVIQFRMRDGELTPFKPLREILSADEVQELKFGQHPEGATMDANDFVTDKAKSPRITIAIPEGARLARFMVKAELDVKHGEDCIVRCRISQEEDTDQGKFVSGLLANPEHPDYPAWKEGVMEFARLLPQVSHREPAPSDRDPIPAPFDNSYNNAERNHFHVKIKYYRDDGFLVEHILDDATRKELDQAWADLLGSADYYDANLRFIADKYQLNLKARQMDELDPSQINSLPEEPKQFLQKLFEDYDSTRNAFRSAEPGHVEDVLEFAERTWRRPLLPAEANALKSYYQELRNEQRLEHRQAIQTLLARILMAPDFLYRLERSVTSADVVPLSDWELASRLSYFLWSSLPDEELSRAAKAGELSDPKNLAGQARRMLRDPKARRLAEEFFGQWFGFYRFEYYKGIDPKRFPEFDDELKASLHEEAVSFFEHIIREDRPVSEILFADYAFLNPELAKHYGMEIAESLGTGFKRVDQVEPFHRGGLLGLGAVLTVTSAPLRTSPVKRGDWVLRRVIGTPVPPPPADAGSIPADDVLGDGLSVRQRLEAHRQSASCRNCHSRIDPLGFALEQYDAIGRWREKYRDGKPIETSRELSDGTTIAGVKGLKGYLERNEDLFHRTMCTRLTGYAFGRGESICDAHLIEQMLTGLKHDNRFASLVEAIVTSRQFRFQRGMNFKPSFEHLPKTPSPESPRD